MISEYDAKNKWCPFARLSEMGGTYNRCGPAANLECIGSQCMAWRWGPNEERKYVKRGEPPPTGDGWTILYPGAQLESWVRPIEQGYCGLAGD